ncbi:conserved hypothetical protein [Gloeothece citriformis PCC 7424]|uniref:Uncharacterized protein n=1 Tax=Gloeothece citriformis (strain PCC 7424) TaxID=65393 RepID=B7KL84_GLOC7|nr:hypothetical protein [Gloeothece citriformis]ACK72456.1 conserved hypothetical protein [Gloeothece citriformis PCC 7424]
MELISSAVISLASAFLKKVWEKTEDKAADTLLEKTNKFLASLRQQSPDTVTAIEKAPTQPLDYGTAILEIESAAKSNPDVAESMAQLAETAKAESIPQLQQKIDEILEKLKTEKHSPTVINQQKLADEIKNNFQGNTFNNTTFQ